MQSRDSHNDKMTDLATTNRSRIRTMRMVSAAIVLAILVVDQGIKIWVKTNMCLGEKIKLADWAYIAFTENRGMAFGLEFVGTLMLCCFRIVAVGALVWLVVKITRSPLAKWGFVVLLSMVLAGATGNIIDNIFYGLVFDDSSLFEPARLVALGQGTGSVFEGKVVDMFYFPMIDTFLPQWMPLCGGTRFIFFSPIFNFADASITTGGVLLVACYHKTLNQLFSHTPRPANRTEE